MNKIIFTKNEILLYSLSLILIVIAWFSTIDNIAYSMNIESIKNTTGAFVIIKGFNAIISLAQNIPFLGAIMTPYDDFLDRMSWVMLISLMSLGLQKIIIIAVQSFLVNTVLTMSFIVLVINKFTKFLSNNATQKAFKLFLLLLFIRYSIPIMTLAITSIENSTYKTQEKVSKERAEELQEKIMGIQKLLSDDKKEQIERKHKIELLTQQNNNLQKQKEILENQINNIKHQTGEFLGMTTYSIMPVDQKTKDKIKNLEEKINNINTNIDKNNEKIDNLDSFFTLANTKEKIKIAILNLNSLMSEVFDTFITWVIMFFFKNVFFPILFLWLLYKIIDKVFNTSPD